MTHGGEEVQLHGFYPGHCGVNCERHVPAALPLGKQPPSFIHSQIQRSRVRFPALPDFLSSSGSGTGSTQPREVN